MDPISDISDMIAAMSGSTLADQLAPLNQALLQSFQNPDVGGFFANNPQYLINPHSVFGNNLVYQETQFQVSSAVMDFISNGMNTYHQVFNSINSSGIGGPGIGSDLTQYTNAIDSNLSSGLSSMFGGLELVGISPETLGLSGL